LEKIVNEMHVRQIAGPNGAGKTQGQSIVQYEPAVGTNAAAD